MRLCVLSAVALFALGVFLSGGTVSPTQRLPHAVQSATAPGTIGPYQTQRLQALVEDEIADLPGIWGVVVHHLETGETAFVNGEHVFTAASLYKLMVLVQAYADVEAGYLDWNYEFVFSREDFNIEPEHMEWEVGTVVTLDEAVDAMITRSVNSAAVMLLRRLGFDRINNLAVSLGLPNTRIGSPTQTTPAEIEHLLYRMAQGQLVSKQASAEMIERLKRQTRDDRIPARLPEHIEVAHKTGELPGIRHDAGIVFAPSGRYIVVLMVEEAPDVQSAARQQAQLSKRIFDYFEWDAMYWFPMMP